jgi:hypothetical protein
MAKIAQINFTESNDGQWIVKQITEDGDVLDGPLMAQELDNWSKLEQVTYQLRAMRFRLVSRSSDDPNLGHYSFQVAPLEPTS